MASKQALDMAFEAGGKAFYGDPEFRTIEACPFSPIDHPEQRAQWIEGFSEALENEPTKADLKSQVAAARKELA